MFRLIALAVFLFALAVIIFPEQTLSYVKQFSNELITNLEISTSNTQRVKNDVINLVESTENLLKKN